MRRHGRPRDPVAEGGPPGFAEGGNRRDWFPGAGVRGWSCRRDTPREMRCGTAPIWSGGRFRMSAGPLIDQRDAFRLTARSSSIKRRSWTTSSSRSRRRAGCASSASTRITSAWPSSGEYQFVLARRKPRPFPLTDGASLSREADRTNWALLNHEPPRTTRYQPEAGRVGFLT